MSVCFVISMNLLYCKSSCETYLLTKFMRNVFINQIFLFFSIFFGGNAMFNIALASRWEGCPEFSLHEHVCYGSNEKRLYNALLKSSHIIYLVEK